MTNNYMNDYLNEGCFDEYCDLEQAKKMLDFYRNRKAKLEKRKGNQEIIDRCNTKIEELMDYINQCTNGFIC